MPNKHHLKKRQQKELKRFAEYMVGGGVWFWSGYIIIVGLNGRWMPFDNPAWDLFIINFIGNSVGIILNFVISRYWVFRTKKPTKLGVATLRYIIYTGLNAFLLNYAILQALRNVGIEPAIGQFIASAFFTLWNYYWYKVWVFKGQDRIRKTKHHA